MYYLATTTKCQRLSKTRNKKLEERMRREEEGGERRRRETHTHTHTHTPYLEPVDQESGPAC